MNVNSPGDMRGWIEISVRLGLLFALVAWCVQIVAPFIGIIVWAVIIAIASDGPYERLKKLLGGRRNAAAAAFVTLSLLILVVPAIPLSQTLVAGAQIFAEDLQDGALDIPPPPSAVAQWPIIGERLHAFWALAADNVEAALIRLEPQLQAVSRWLLAAAGSAGVGLLQLLASIVVAGALLARSDGRTEAITRFAERLVGRRGPELVGLARSTVRSVVQGILGVALIQAMLAGLAYTVMGIPGAGLWALLVLVSAVVQIPPLIVMLPPIAIVLASHGTAVTVAFGVWCVLVALLDNVLKPMLFGRGMQVPTLVIFVGAIGGMLSMGIIGLFVGAVVLVLGYELFVTWLDEMREDASDASEAS